MENLFEIFLKQWNLSTIQQAFYQLCINKGVDPTDYTNVYEKLKNADRFCDSNFKQKQLWNLLDARRQQKVYQNQTVCRGMNVLIVGAGPCGLRAAIECSLLGAHVVVVDSRDKFTRNNVLHLWKFVIEDLKNLGAKVFMPKFCTGSIEHIAIRKLQFILLKVALVLGVQFYDKIEYKDLKEPQDGKGWRAVLEPSDHLLSDYEFDVILGASGKNKCLPAFKHNPVRGKLAIGITANFVRHKNKDEDSVPEIQGVAYVYRQDYFDDLEKKTKIQLENIVYYKGDTHYFVMCGKKDNLITKGVIKENKEDIKSLLSQDNIDNEMLCKYVTQVVDYATEGKLGQLEFALNARKRPDIAAFDFTTLESADHSTRFVKYMGHPLILSLIGDSLHEPFWPTGSGCARGFLSLMDTAWLLRNVGLCKEPMSKLLGEREGIYSLLSQTQPNNLSNSYHTYTIDPSKRYRRFNPIIPCVDHLMGSEENDEDLAQVVMKIRRQKTFNVEFHQRSSLFRFCFMAALSKKIRISSFRRSSWSDGCALATLISKYNPDFTPTVPITSLSSPAILCTESFLYAEKQLSVPQPCKTHYEWATMKECDRIEYLQRLVEVLRENPLYTKNCMSPTLLTNYNQDKLLASAFQDRILKPRQFVNTCDTIFNFASLETNCVTVRSKRQKLDIQQEFLLNKRKSSIEPLNPELLHKINNIASNASKKLHLNEHSVPNGIEKSSKFAEPIHRNSLTGLNSVTKFKEKFDSNFINIQQIPKSTSNSTTSSQISSKSDTDTSSAEEEHPADPMHIKQTVGSLPSNGVSNGKNQSNLNGVSNGTNVVYRSTTQHQFVNSRRPISTPNILASPDLCKTFGHPTKAVNLAQQQVYKTVSQRRMKCCALCQKEVYLTEQLIVDDRLAVHKQCFRCSFCNRTLEPGKAHVDRSFIDKFGARWYCAQHTNKSQFEKLQQLSKSANKQKSSTLAIISPTKPSFPQRTFVQSSSTESSTTSLHQLEEKSQEPIARPPTPPNKNGRLSNPTKYRKRLSNLNSPTQLIEACKERTNQRLVLLGLQEVVIDENLELKTCKNEQQSSSDQENDVQSSESFEEEYYEDTLEDEEECLEEFLSEDDQVEDANAWDELKSYLENALIDSQLLTQLCSSTSTQAKDLIENFNRRALLNHFNSKTPAISKQASPPYFTPREGRSETVPSEPNEAFFTPRSTLRPGITRRSSTLDRGARGVSKEVDQLKMKIQQNAGQFENPVIANKPNGDSQTPKRTIRQRIRRGPRRATVAIDLKRESFASDDSVAAVNLKDRQKSELGENGKLRRSPSNRRQAFHIQPTDDNLQRIIKEIEAVKHRRKNEKERQLQSFQRRLQELEVRLSQVCNMGKYLEGNLRTSPRNKWELEQWLIYVQQYEELCSEEQQLKYKLKVAQLEDQYSQLKVHLHIQQDATLTPENQLDKEKSEKETMERLLELLNEKDSVKALLSELQSETIKRTSPAQLVQRAPSYTCYAPVFLEEGSKH